MQIIWFRWKNRIRTRNT